MIGRGSFGDVYLGLNVTTGEMLAVKQVVRSNKLDLEGIMALHKEIETMKDLDHKHIVQYLGYERKNNTYSLFWSMLLVDQLPCVSNRMGNLMRL